MSLRLSVNKNDHIQGNMNAPLELVEYGDYECSYCGEAYYEVKKLQKKLGDKLMFVFRNFPLTNIHENALNAAIASEIAGNSGKFWEMHDILYENQDALEEDDLLRYAKKIGLDTDVFKSKFSDPKYRQKVEEDLESGLKSGVNGTPSFFINGKKYNGDYSTASMLSYLKEFMESV